MLLPILFIYLFISFFTGDFFKTVEEISTKLATQRQMGWNRKRVQTSEICGRQVGEQKFHFWGGPTHLIHPTWRPNEGIFFKKATLCSSDRTNFVQDDENYTKSAEPCPSNVGEFVPTLSLIHI